MSGLGKARQAGLGRARIGEVWQVWHVRLGEARQGGVRQGAVRQVWRGMEKFQILVTMENLKNRRDSQ